MAKTETKGGAGKAESLPAAGSTASGIPTHTFEVSRGPIVSKATTSKEALGIEEAETETPKGKPVRIKSRAPRYTAHGQTFRSDDDGLTYWPGDFTDEQWKSIRSNPQLVVSKASVSDE